VFNPISRIRKYSWNYTHLITLVGLEIINKIKLKVVLKGVNA
jgi:hypothetical protein